MGRNLKSLCDLCESWSELAASYSSSRGELSGEASSAHQESGLVPRSSKLQGKRSNSNIQGGTECYNGNTFAEGLQKVAESLDKFSNPSLHWGARSTPLSIHRELSDIATKLKTLHSAFDEAQKNGVDPGSLLQSSRRNSFHSQASTVGPNPFSRKLHTQIQTRTSHVFILNRSSTLRLGPRMRMVRRSKRRRRDRRGTAYGWTTSVRT